MEFANMIKNKYNCTPLEFGKRIDAILNDIVLYIGENFEKVIKIENIEGHISPEIPTGYFLSDKTGVIEINFNFKTNFNSYQCATKSRMIFDFRWMRKIFTKYLSL
jgi:hypothetical protein